MPGQLVRRLVAPLAPLLLLAGCTEGSAKAAPEPTAEPTRTESAAPLSPAEIVDDPASQLVEVRFVPGDRDRRAALWRRCAGARCLGRELAVVLTDDGFRTRTVADATWRNATVRISDDGQVVVIDYRARLRIDVVRTDGSVTHVEMSRDGSPVASGEVVAGVHYRPGEQLFWATDPSTASAHLVPVPDGTQQLVQTDTGQLRALIEGQSYAWSDDGGVTWNRLFDALDPHLLPGFVSSADDTHVVVGGGDGATLFPFSQIRRLEDDGDWSVVVPVHDPMAYVGPTAVLPDGRFLVAVEAWSDNGRIDQPRKGTRRGIYVSVDDDWAAYERIQSGAPFSTPAASQILVVAIDVTADGTLITALGPDQTTAWTSKDVGVTWLEMRVR